MATCISVELCIVPVGQKVDWRQVSSLLFSCPLLSGTHIEIQENLMGLQFSHFELVAYAQSTCKDSLCLHKVWSASCSLINNYL